jgi:hypothetical protein
LSDEREVPEGFVDGNKRLAKLLASKPHLAKKVRALRAKWLTADYEAEHGVITDEEIQEGRKHYG